MPVEPALQCFTTIAALRARVAAWRLKGERVALAPTMGALHDGHRLLMTQARAHADRVIVSIFVNPTQFGPTEDFSRYPRDLEADLAFLSTAGIDAAYVPPTDVMYPPDFSTKVMTGDLAGHLCGAFRLGHFDGVATVVTKLIMQAQPDVAVFGEKDFQQLQVIRRAARDLDLPVEIIGAPTARHADGLALSSRNRYLAPTERAIAPRLHAVLSTIAIGASTGGPVAPFLAQGIVDLTTSGFGPVQYLIVCDADTLSPVERVTSPARVLAAAYLGRTRLIDNVAIDQNSLNGRAGGKGKS